MIWQIGPGTPDKDTGRKSYLQAVAEIEKQCFSDPWTLPMIEESLGTGLDVYLLLLDEEAAFAAGKAALAQVTAGESLSMADQASFVVGYCVFRVIAGEGELFRIAVAPGRRGLGYGRKLMDGMVDYARENRVRAVTLEVRESNMAARNLYRAYGFTEESVRKNYYREPVEDAIIMWKRGI